jgi:hypothetical protein
MEHCKDGKFVVQVSAGGINQYWEIRESMGTRDYAYGWKDALEMVAREDKTGNKYRIELKD